MNVTDAIPTPTASGKTNFMNFNASYSINKNISVSGGQDIGWNGMALCRFSLSSGVNFRPQKKPIMVRIMLKHNSIRLTEVEPWRRIYSCNIETTYRFKSGVK